MSLIASGKLTLLGKVFLILLTTWALALIVPDFWRATGQVQVGILGFVVDNNGKITEVDAPTLAVPSNQEIDGHKRASKAPPAVGETIDLTRTDFADLVYLYAQRGGLQYVPMNPPGGVYSYVVDGQNGQSRRVLIRPQLYKTDVSGNLVLIASQLAGVFFVITGALLLWLKPSAMTLGFFLYALWFNPGECYTAYFILEKWPWAVVTEEAIEAIIQTVGCLGFLVFALSFPGGTVTSWRKKVAAALPFALIILLSLQLASYGTVFGLHVEGVTREAYISEYIVEILVIISLFVRLREQDPIGRQRIRWVIYGCAIGLPTMIIADSASTTSMWNGLWNAIGYAGPSETVENFVMLFGVLVPITVAHAVLRHHVIDIQLVVRRAVAQTGLWLAVGVLLMRLIISIEEPARNRMTPFMFIAVIIAVSLLFEWLHGHINEFIDRAVYPHLHRATERLGLAGVALGEADSLQAVERILIDEPTEALQLGSAAVFVCDEHGIYKQRLHGVGWDEHASTTISADEPLVTELRSVRRTIRLREVAFSTSCVPRGTAQPVVAVPVQCHKELAAILLYGIHRTGDDLDAREVDALDRLGICASAALEEYENDRLRKELEKLKALLAKSAHSPIPAHVAAKPKGGMPVRRAKKGA